MNPARLLPLMLALAASPAQAAPGQFASLSAIDNAVAAFTGQPIGVSGGAALPVDRRLRLAACAAPLALAWHGSAHASVSVLCPDAGSWRIFVPVTAAARQEPATAAVERGENITVAVVGDGFTVSQPAEALESGPVGAWIRVRTGPKTSPVRARIMRPGLAEMPVE
ncbi:flagella basal body P-ring formation protein FlgA [Novosphingobium sp. Chol11]|uniref:flagella basal body P-ring formation protein FlgA n=1 Tax=Novosphingobium sp. Chol11 TaxID=1385763 RepID=UPI0025D88950|nr:flagella basal body P-ring formation protein FlgA [Novosphingobium sp. Chol11]